MNQFSMTDSTRVLAFQPTPFRPGERKILTTRLRPELVKMHRFYVKKLVVPSSIGLSFVIHDFRIGKDSQFDVPSAVPAAAFDERAIGNDLQCDRCDDREISLDVEMLSRPKPNRFVLWLRRLLWIRNDEFEMPSLFAATLIGTLEPLHS